MERTWLYSFLDRPTSKLPFGSTSEITISQCTSSTHTNTCSPLRVWQWRVKSCDAWELYRQDRLQKAAKTLNAWKNRKLPQFQWSRKKNSREKCQQQIAAGSYCHRRHGLWFSHVSFLPYYASSFHPIKHKYRQQNNSGSISLLFTLGEKSRAKQRKTCQWNNEQQKG